MSSKRPAWIAQSGMAELRRMAEYHRGTINGIQHALKYADLDKHSDNIRADITKVESDLIMIEAEIASRTTHRSST